MHTSSLSLSPSSDPSLKHLVRSAVRKYAELCGFRGHPDMTSTYKTGEGVEIYLKFVGKQCSNFVGGEGKEVRKMDVI